MPNCHSERVYALRPVHARNKGPVPDTFMAAVLAATPRVLSTRRPGAERDARKKAVRRGGMVGTYQDPLAEQDSTSTESACRLSRPG